MRAGEEIWWQCAPAGTESRTMFQESFFKNEMIPAMEPPSIHRIHNTESIILVDSDPITAAAYKKSGLS